MERNERFERAVNYLKMQGVVAKNEEVAVRMGADPSNVSRSVKGVGKNPTDRFLRRFNDAFGNIFNIDWLLTGFGDMLAPSALQRNTGGSNIQNTGSNNTNTTTYNTNNYKGCGGADAKAARDIADMGDRITALEGAGEGGAVKSSGVDMTVEVQTVPLVPISAQGGSFNDFVVSVRESECERIISPIKGADWAMSVAGDSMAPEYPSGSQILIKKINERAFIDWGKVYVLDTCNGSVIKKLFPSDEPDKVVCKSINPEYPPFEVSMQDVYGVYRVLMCMSLK